MRIYSSILLCLAVSLLFSGCGDKPAPSPEITRVDPSSQARTPYWINPQEVSLAESEGLELRDPLFDDMLDPMGGSGGANNDILNEPPFASVYFDFDQSYIRPDQREEVEDTARFMQSNPDARLIIRAHADWRGTEEYNMALSERRGNSVKEYLGGLQVDQRRSEVIPRGSLDATKEANEQVMARDRRADLYIIK